MLIAGFGEGARQTVRADRPRCAGPSGCLAVLAFRGVSLELASLRQSRALIRERLRSSATHRGSPGPHRLPGALTNASDQAAATTPSTRTVEKANGGNPFNNRCPYDVRTSRLS